MWHASVSLNDRDRVVYAIDDLDRPALRLLERFAKALVGSVGRSDLARWDRGLRVLHYRRALTAVELVAVQALDPEFLSCPAVDVAGDAAPYKPLTGPR